MNKSSLLRNLPSVDKVLSTVRDRDYALPETFVVSQIRETIDSFRQQILTGSPPEIDDPEAMEELVVNEVDRRCRDRIGRMVQPLINATGIVLHTGLGRAPLSDLSRDAMTRAAYGYTNLEFDLPSGTRGERNDHIEDLLRALTGAESALMVNNNAAAVFLALNTLAAGSDAIISRGQLIEIGGSFRIPEVMAKSGARMVEVGTTNRTHLRDYQEAV
ncbi:MAG TPA: L-seryl-tRNA(Sec) selenium transferase, partial [bacterium]|nr:L-seryl-tRNA(Sec) selenium transferase [bacterium]